MKIECLLLMYTIFFFFLGTSYDRSVLLESQKGLSAEERLGCRKLFPLSLEEQECVVDCHVEICRIGSSSKFHFDQENSIFVLLLVRKKTRRGKVGVWCLSRGDCKRGTLRNELLLTVNVVAG